MATLLCSRCFKSYPLDQLVPHMGAYLCRACYQELFNTTPDEIAARDAEKAAERVTLREAAWRERGEQRPRAQRLDRDDVIVSTTEGIAGYRVDISLDIVTAECAFGMNLFRDFFAAVRDVVGGRSDSTQQVLRDARLTCLAELRSEALSIGGNAVIGVRLDYSEFSGGGKSMLFLVASGTAVRVSPIDATSASPSGAG